MGKRPKQTFFQRKQTDGQQGHGKDAQTANYQRNANQNYNEIPPHTDDVIVKKITCQKMEWPLSKNLQTSAGEDVETREPSCSVGGDVN